LHGNFRRDGFSARHLKILGCGRDRERCAITAKARRL
jgi:hypothetical protein